MLTISPLQIEVLANATLDRFKAQMVNHLSRLAPDHAKHMGPEGMDAFLDMALARARLHGIRQRDCSRFWLELSVLWGVGFTSDPTYGFAHRIIAEPLPELQRMRRLHRATADYLRTTCGGDGARFTAALKRLDAYGALNLPPEPPVEDTWIARAIAGVWPERAQAAGSSACQALAEAGSASARSRDLTSNNARLVFSLMALLLGIEFLSDPQHRWLMARLDAPAQSHERFAALVSGATAYLRASIKNG